VSDHKIRWTRWLLTPLKIALFALLCWFIYGAMVSANKQLDGHEWRVEGIWLVVSAALYLVSLLPGAYYWYRVMRQTGQEVRLGEALRAHYISQLG
jgi:hypothetical protein